MARSEARGVGPALFDRDWSRVSGSWQGLAKKAQMVRAARGYSPAIFKPIAKGGCHTGAQLRAQLTYLTTKSSHILDSRGTHDGKKTLTEAEIDRVVRRFENQWSERHSPKLGHTSHLLMAFPVGTSGEEVRAITETVCERFFQGEGSQFDYIAAIHQDRAHPHAHIVLNRRSKDGEMFFLGKDHHFNYDAFRVAMVEAAQVHGIRLEATRRLDRGVTTYRAETREVYKARDEGRPPVERQRTGADLAAALETVARNALTYRGLAAEASRSNFDDVAEALKRASTILANGGQIQSDGAIYMSQDETAFDTLITEFSQNIRQIEAAIERAPAGDRPEIERKLSDVLTSVAQLNPLGVRSAALLDAPSRDGVYVRANMREDQVARLDDDTVKARLSEVLQGTGIDPEAVAARMREGAGNAALERQWLAQDLRAVAKAGDLDLEKDADREDALDRLEAIHVRLGDALTDARILRVVEEVKDDAVAQTERAALPARERDIFAPSERRDFQDLVAQFRRTDFDHPFSDDPSVYKAGVIEVEEARAAFNAYAQRSPDHAELASMAWEKITDSRRPPEYAVAENDRRLHAGDMDLALRDPSQQLGPITEDMRTLALYRAEMPDEEFGMAVEEEISRLRAMGASRAYISERSLEIEDQARQSYAERRFLAETAPDVTTFLRRAEAEEGHPLSDAAGQRLVAQIDRNLAPDAITALRAGHADVLDKFTQDPLRQLELAKAYLESSEVTAHGAAMERVLDALAEEQIEAQRARHAAGHGEKGITHG
ncbi:relaxase/mobilization nuclease domain-containing protein [Phaeovulum vinaykumarii]|uniref:Type IV secretion system T-DNA border endonuclease VirD2 n=1 Tax=Phaeovulum vinaykumarii TaxID=407234 RepID=A0A1N7MWN2_9RHOB|nr:relaxase/mobilization nuclease domain-containing protein [Phaeovulum vinaykumarii]SIS90533.1 type IV secretion system T-DNA border endonuclease VirD2 [Phaeovulum vinaykumarii]SOC16231.1 type IV secretion system T-DNA border endonuclease VirD2 [Phaeovulum vinaykumarii]